MKKKLIAIILTVTVIAGVGAVVYNTNKDVDNIEITENDSVKIVDNDKKNKNNNSSDGIVKTEENVEQKEQLINGEAANSIENNNSSTLSLEDNKSETVDKPTTPPLVEKPVTPPVEQKPVTPPIVQKPVTPPAENKPQPPAADSQSMASVEQAIFNMVNQERAKAGVPALSYNSTMEYYARLKSQDMGERGYFDHANPEGELITAQMQRDGVSYNAWGENIAYIGGVSDANALATQFMNNWMNSDGHRKNILSTNFNGIGVGVCKVGNKVYATQEFYR